MGYRFAAFIVAMLLGAGSATAGDAGDIYPFAFSEGEDGTALEVVFELLRAGIDDSDDARKTYDRWVLPGRKASKEGAGALADKEWSNLTGQAHNYLANDLDTLKGWVQKMNPHPNKINRSTKKVYITLRNQMDSMREGMFIIERDKTGKWKLRTLNL
ncbi:MAG: hypothetical protein ABIK09_07380 [Pseudomonadota bacterium]